MTAGYSKKSLAEKLGIKKHFTVAFSNPPAHYVDLLKPLPEGVIVASEKSRNLDFVHAFSTDSKKLIQIFPRLKRMISKTGILWISWPKKSSGIDTDLSGNVVRAIGLDNGLVDVKVAAVDETWSGLKFVYRLKDR